jgi:hypothetical protein
MAGNLTFIQDWINWTRAPQKFAVIADSRTHGSSSRRKPPDDARERGRMPRPTFHGKGPWSVKPESPSHIRRSSMNDTPENPALGGGARETNGEIGHLHPMTKIKHLREYYGAHFANGWDGESTLGELLKESKFASLPQYVRHFRHRPVKKQ